MTTATSTPPPIEGSSKELIQLTIACIEQLLGNMHRLRTDYAAGDTERLVDATSLQLGLLTAVVEDLTERSASLLGHELFEATREEMRDAMNKKPDA